MCAGFSQRLGGTQYALRGRELMELRRGLMELMAGGAL
jgi:hypothetical protein